MLVHLALAATVVLAALHLGSEPRVPQPAPVSPTGTVILSAEAPDAGPGDPGPCSLASTRVLYRDLSDMVLVPPALPSIPETPDPSP